MKPIGIIGGSGLYEMAALKNVDRVQVDTPFGQPSAPLIVGDLEGQRVIFLPRHGLDHSLLPQEINYRANIFALKQAQVEKVVSVSAVGSLRPEIEPGHLVVPDQFIDLTQKRTNTFFGNGLVGHSVFAEPITERLATSLYQALQDTAATAHRGGTYVCIEGPSFSTRAESKIYQSWEASIIGMTNATEAKLAREAELEYATLALVTDYDAWRQEVTEINEIIATMKANIHLAQETIQKLVGYLKDVSPESCHQSSMKFSIVTPPSAIQEETKRSLSPLYGAYF